MSQLNISDEKKYLYEMMREITTERRRLTDMFYELKPRLDELIRLETKGLDRVPIKGIVDLHNAQDASRQISNIQRQADHAIQAVKQEAEIKFNPVEKEIIPKAEIEIEKEKEVKQTQSRRGKGMSLDKAAGVIAHILKDKGIPLKAKDLHELVNEQVDTPIELGNFTKNTLPRSSKLNPRINNVSRGYWQYLNK